MIPPSAPLAYERAVVAALLAAFAILAVPFGLLGDLWYDEVWNLEHYQLASVGHVLTDYATPNNHVLYSLLGNLWLRVVGVGDLDGALAQPWLVRLPGLLYTLGALGYVWVVARRHAGPAAGLWALGIAVTTVPVLHFAAQARGYGLAMLALAAALHHGLAARGGARRHAVGLVVATAALVWCNPANLYAAGALVVTLGTVAWRSGIGWRVAAYAVLGVLLGVLLLAPVLGQLVASPFVQSAAPFRWATLTDTAPSVLGALLSARWALLAAAALALGAAAVAPRGQRPPLGLAAACALLLVLPFVVSFARGDRSYERVFAPLVVVFAVALGALVAAGLTALRDARVRRAVLAVLLVTLPVSFGTELHRLAGVRRDALAGIGRVQDLAHGYYCGPFAPGRVAAAAVRAAAGAPVFLGDVDLPAVAAYVTHAGGAVGPAAELMPTLRARGEAYLITAAPEATMAKLWAKMPGIGIERLELPLSYHGVLRLRRGISAQNEAPAAPR